MPRIVLKLAANKFHSLFSVTISALAVMSTPLYSLDPNRIERTVNILTHTHKLNELYYF